MIISQRQYSCLNYSCNDITVIVICDFHYCLKVKYLQYSLSITSVCFHSSVGSLTILFHFLLRLLWCILFIGFPVAFLVECLLFQLPDADSFPSLSLSPLSSQGLSFIFFITNDTVWYETCNYAPLIALSSISPYSCHWGDSVALSNVFFSLEKMSWKKLFLERKWRCLLKEVKHQRDLFFWIFKKYFLFLSSLHYVYNTRAMIWRDTFIHINYGFILNRKNRSLWQKEERARDPTRDTINIIIIIIVKSFAVSGINSWAGLGNFCVVSQDWVFLLQCLILSSPYIFVHWFFILTSQQDFVMCLPLNLVLYKYPWGWIWEERMLAAGKLKRESCICYCCVISNSDYIPWQREAFFIPCIIRAVKEESGRLKQGVQSGYDFFLLVLTCLSFLYDQCLSVWGGIRKVFSRKFLAMTQLQMPAAQQAWVTRLFRKENTGKEAEKGGKHERKAVCQSDSHVFLSSSVTCIQGTQMPGTTTRETLQDPLCHLLRVCQMKEEQHQRSSQIDRTNSIFDPLSFTLCLALS